MRHCLLKCCKVHIGKDDMGRKILEIYRKPEIKEISEQEVNTIVIQFLRDLRKTAQSKNILDLLDGIQTQVEKICPFGSMMKIAYQLEGGNDSWFVPNREDTHCGMVRVSNFMNYFLDATGGNTPILIKNVFESGGFGSDKMTVVTVNGKKQRV